MSLPSLSGCFAIWQVVSILGVTIVLFTISLALYRVHLSPLAKFPGPVLAAATSWYETFVDLTGNNFPEILQGMHHTYGPIVRVSPWEIHINDADFYDQVFVTSNKRRTNISAISNPTTFSLGCEGSITSTELHEEHRQRRKPIERFFSRQGITKIEWLIHQEAMLLGSKLQDYKDTGATIRLNCVFSSFTGDVIGKVSCGESPHLLGGPDFSPQWYDSNRRMLDFIPVLRNAAWLGRSIKKIPIPMSLLEAIMPSAASFKIVSLFSVDRINKIKAELTSTQGKSADTDHVSVFHALLSDDVDESVKDVQRLQGEAFVLVGAGTVTTSSTLAIITYHVLANPHIQERLSTELGDIMKCFPDQQPRWADLEKVPYLAACIKEGLRMNRHFRRQVRISPDADIQYKEWIIPKNVREMTSFDAGTLLTIGSIKTPVGMSNYLLHFDPEVFPKPTEFIPERWLGDYDPRMNRNWVPFARGSRNCVGMNLSLAEMYIVLGVMFRPNGCKLSLVSSDVSSVLPIHDSDVGVPKAGAGLIVRVNSV